MMNRYATMGLAFAATATAISITAPNAHAQFQGETLRASVRGDGQLDNGDRGARLNAVSVDLRRGGEAVLRFTPQGNYRTNDMNFNYRGRWRRDGDNSVRVSLTDGASGDGVIYLTDRDAIDRLDLSGRANGDSFRIRFATLQNGRRPGNGGTVGDVPRPGGYGGVGGRDRIPPVLRPRDGDNGYGYDDDYNNGRNRNRDSNWDERRDGDRLRSLDANRRGDGKLTIDGGRDQDLDRYEVRLRQGGAATIVLHGTGGFDRTFTGRWSGGDLQTVRGGRDRRDSIEITLGGGGGVFRNNAENGRGRLYFRNDGDGFDRLELNGRLRDGSNDTDTFRVTFRPDR